MTKFARHLSIGNRIAQILGGDYKVERAEKKGTQTAAVFDVIKIDSNEKLLESLLLKDIEVYLDGVEFGRENPIISRLIKATTITT